MGKKRWKTVGISVITLILLALLIFWVFRDHYQEILWNIRSVHGGALAFLLGMGVLYQLLEASVCRCLVSSQLPALSLRQAVEVTFLGVFGNVSCPVRSLYRCFRWQREYFSLYWWAEQTQLPVLYRLSISEGVHESAQLHIEAVLS